MANWMTVTAALIALALAGCRADPQAKERAEKEREAAMAKAREDREGNADWGKVGKDAARIQEKSRSRAEQQRAQALERANKQTEKE